MIKNKITKFTLHHPPDGLIIASTHLSPWNITNCIEGQDCQDCPDIVCSSIIFVMQFCDVGCRLEYDAIPIAKFTSTTILYFKDQGMKEQSYDQTPLPIHQLTAKFWNFDQTMIPKIKKNVEISANIIHMSTQQKVLQPMTLLTCIDLDHGNQQ